MLNRSQNRDCVTGTLCTQCSYMGEYGKVINVEKIRASVLSFC